ncbi:MAG: InlB B-repeat-containing protein [Clostridium sp.]|nr:InlB B-repeat-containing protein [Acetatifactor muris]MCM1527382.1 InlB B-repeat-containing protein [Bacteroides sp.]MCM1563554.1 InlB B-repeat-containing protein [Clostridium sp.]
MQSNRLTSAYHTKKLRFVAVLLVAALLLGMLPADFMSVRAMAAENASGEGSPGEPAPVGDATAENTVGGAPGEVSLDESAAAEPDSGETGIMALADSTPTYKLATVNYTDPQKVDEDGIRIVPSGYKKSDGLADGILGKHSEGTLLTLGQNTSGTLDPYIEGQRRFYFIWRGWAVQGANGEINPDCELVAPIGEDGSQSFTMPAEALNIFPTWTRKEYHTLTYEWDSVGASITGADAPKVPAGITQADLGTKSKTAYKDGDHVDFPAVEDVVITDATGTKLYHFEGWSAPANVTVDATGFIMPDENVTLTGRWSSKSVHDITYQWAEDGEGPAAIDLAKLTPSFAEDGATITLPAFGDEEYDTEVMDYTFEGWYIGSVKCDGNEVTITQDTVFTGKWSRTAKKKFAITTEIKSSEGFDFTGAIQDLKKDIPSEQDPYERVYLPKLDKNAEIPNHAHCVFSGWTVTNTATDQEITLKTQGDQYYFTMPESDVKITATVIRESRRWEAKGSDGALLVTVERDNPAFDQPKPAQVELEVWVDDPDAPDKAEADAKGSFQFNYSGNNGFGCVDLNITPAEGYYIYKVEYTACFGKNGPEKNGWKSGDPGKTTFLMDNVTEGTTAKIYLTKAYKVEYHFEIEGVADAVAADILDNYPASETVTDLFPCKVEAVVDSCDNSGTYHNTCTSTKNQEMVRADAKAAFEDGYDLQTVFEVPDVQLKTNQAANYVYKNNGNWKGPGSKQVSPGTSFDLAEADVTEMAGLISPDDPYTISLTFSLAPKAAGDTKCDYKVLHFYQQADGSYLQRVSETLPANVGETVTAQYKTTSDASNALPAYLTANTTHAERVESGTAAEGLVLKLYYDRKKYTVTFNAGDQGKLNGTEDSVEDSIFYGAAFPARPTTDANEDYVFEGWYDESGKEIENFPTTVTKDVIYTARWIGKVPYRTEHYFEGLTGDYTVNAGLTSEEAKGAPGDEVTAAVLETGKMPAGYVENTDHKDRNPEDILPKTGEVVLKRYYKLERHTVTFNAGRYGTFDRDQDTMVESDIPYGSDFPELPEPVADDSDSYAFIGWYITGTDTPVVTFPENVTEDLSYTARWVEKVDYSTEHYFEQLGADGQTSGYEVDDNCTIEERGVPGDVVTAATLEQIPPHYEEIEHAGRVLKGTLPNNSTLVLKRYYGLVSYTVTFEAGAHGTLDGQELSVSKPAKYGSAFPAPPATNPAEDYEFDAWYWRDPDTGVETEVMDYPDTMTKDVVFVAHWKTDKAEYLTDYYLEEQNAAGEYVYVLKESVSNTAIPDTEVTAVIKSFANYTENREHENWVDSGMAVRDSLLTLELYYSLNEYKITFDGGEHGSIPGVDGPVTGSHKHGSKFPDAPEVTAEEGWKFDGWYDDRGELGFPETVGADATYTAHWTKIPDPVPGAVTYLTEHYLEQPDGTYRLADTDSAQGTAGATVQAVARPYAHYTENPAHAGRIASGTLSESAGLTLRLYYELDSHTITFNGGDHGKLPGTLPGTLPGGGNTVTLPYKYGSAFPALPVPAPAEGYVFEGWYDGYGNKIVGFPATVDRNQVYTARWQEVDDDDDDDPAPEQPSAAVSPKTGESALPFGPVAVVSALTAGVIFLYLLRRRRYDAL